MTINCIVASSLLLCIGLVLLLPELQARQSEIGWQKAWNVAAPVWACPWQPCAQVLFLLP